MNADDEADELPPRTRMVAEEQEREQRVEDRDRALDDRRKAGVEAGLPHEQPERQRRVHEPDDDEPDPRATQVRDRLATRRASGSPTAASTTAAQPMRARMSVDGASCRSAILMSMNDSPQMSASSESMTIGGGID